VRQALLEGGCQFQGGAGFHRAGQSQVPRPGSDHQHPAGGSRSSSSFTMSWWTCLARRTQACSSAANPSCVLMVGCTARERPPRAAKLGRLLHKAGTHPAARGSGRVPARQAIGPLETLGKQLQLPVFAHKGEPGRAQIAREALGPLARANNRQHAYFDTAGACRLTSHWFRSWSP